MEMSDHINELATALSTAQAEMDFARKDSANPFFKSSYADLASVWDVCRRVLPKNGLAVSQTMEPGEGVRVRTTLMHTSGQWISGVIVLPPVKNDPQAYGSAVTYGRRYSLSAIVGVIADDDDAESAMDRKPHKPATIDKPKALKMIKAAKSMGELKDTWLANSWWHQDLELVQAKDARKAELEAA
jgi:hypothetical protein